MNYEWSVNKLCVMNQESTNEPNEWIVSELWMNCEWAMNELWANCGWTMDELWINRNVNELWKNLLKINCEWIAIKLNLL